ncbi:MAG: HAMP domain-containing histidine kinase [Rhodospirillales bacterium]|nr:HAMP domain-containing histidine kinase [Rhodospirillales bacterium]
MAGRRQVFFYAVVSVLITIGLGFIAMINALPEWLPHIVLTEQGKFDPPLWLPILVIGFSSALSVSILSILTLRLIRELKARDNSLLRAEEERLSFAADAAHELRTPLAILRAHIDSLDFNDTTRQLRDDVDQTSRIVEQVLVKSRIEAIEVKADETVDLSQLIKDLAAYIAPLVIKEGRSIEVLGADKPIDINANAFAIEQALRNLVENAIKYSSRGSTITIALIDQGNEYQLRVIDQGRGVPQEARELIFERFRRADRRGAGSGLGLSIVRRVAEAHGGRVSVEDAPEGGAVFILHLPRRRRK